MPQEKCAEMLQTREEKCEMLQKRVSCGSEISQSSKANVKSGTHFIAQVLPNVPEKVAMSKWKR
jgi:hypothetical protein